MSITWKEAVATIIYNNYADKFTFEDMVQHVPDIVERTGSKSKDPTKQMKSILTTLLRLKYLDYNYEDDNYYIILPIEELLGINKIEHDTKHADRYRYNDINEDVNAVNSVGDEDDQTQIMPLDESDDDDESYYVDNSDNKKSYKKKSIPQSLKRKVWDNRFKGKTKGTCYCCSKNIDIQNHECGHVIAESKGGKTIESNLRPVCSKCNKSMGTQNMKEFRQQYFEKKSTNNNLIKSVDDIIRELDHFEEKQNYFTLKEIYDIIMCMESRTDLDSTIPRISSIHENIRTTLYNYAELYKTSDDELTQKIRMSLDNYLRNLHIR